MEIDQMVRLACDHEEPTWSGKGLPRALASETNSGCVVGDGGVEEAGDSRRVTH
jgi:hypothetical protein